ncbi:PREDICTED: uncharacterized protein LOC109236338 [Nicotiana attenuata]|uniref:uncharacterized protein LOC109236338 n=1 Tax=Nicotiana attenuata TaxID=49451 RepID=UPI00090551C1|nr:PREDICTED: uncharacterized protein LOC109236338 [Nicotiana attenuata]
MIPASAEPKKPEQRGVDDEDDYNVPRSFIALDDIDSTKSTVEEFEKVILIEHLPDRKTCRNPTEGNHSQDEFGSKVPSGQQKRRPQSAIKHAFIKDEESKLLKIGSVLEVKYSYWLANIVVVPKKGNKLKMCVDYKDLDKETFDILRKYNMKLNSEKCAFRVGSGKFLGFMVSDRGIEINPDKIKAIEDITIVEHVKAFQRLTGRIAALGRFITRSSDKSQWFFSLLKKKNSFSWTPECQQALEELKRYLSSPSLWYTLKADEQLYLYLAVSEAAISGVLVREEEGMQFPVYYVSITLCDAETRYPHLEKLALALLRASKKLKSYFQCHPKCVLTSYPLRNIMQKPKHSGWLAKWAVDISGYNIEYRPRTAIQSQILEFFVANFMPTLIHEVDRELLLTLGTISRIWTLFTDGASNTKGSRLGIVLKPPAGIIIRQFIRIVKLTNNETEYEAIFVGLELAKSIEAEVIEAKCDSLLIVNQVNRTFEVKVEWMRRYLDKLQVTRHQFKEWTLQHVPRDKNSELDALANLSSSVDSDDFSSGAVVQLMNSVVEEGHVKVNSTGLTYDWRSKYIDYLKTRKLPSDPKESRALRTKAARFSLVKGALFRRSFFGPLARCLGLRETKYAMKEVHEGTYGNHLGAESLVRKLIRAGYYWNEMEKDVNGFVWKYGGCKGHAPMIHQPGEMLHPVLSPWPFMK